MAGVDKKKNQNPCNNTLFYSLFSELSVFLICTYVKNKSYEFTKHPSLLNPYIFSKILVTYILSFLKKTLVYASQQLCTLVFIQIVENLDP